jgi:hypothetical protein
MANVERANDDNNIVTSKLCILLEEGASILWWVVMVVCVFRLVLMLYEFLHQSEGQEFPIRYVFPQIERGRLWMSFVYLCLQRENTLSIRAANNLSDLSTFVVFLRFMASIGRKIGIWYQPLITATVRKQICPGPLYLMTKRKSQGWKTTNVTNDPLQSCLIVWT